MDPPPYKWGDRYDLIGLAVAAGLVAALLLADVSLALIIVLGCAALNLTAYALRRRAGIPQVTLRSGCDTRGAERPRESGWPDSNRRNLRVPNAAL
jgi:hypothetical protein